MCASSEEFKYASGRIAADKGWRRPEYSLYPHRLGDNGDMMTYADEIKPVWPAKFAFIGAL